MADQYAWWKAALGGTRGPINGDEPQAGFYETRSKNRVTGEESKGVIAYWYNADGKMLCRAGAATMIEDMKARERWPFAAKRPILKGTYDEFLKTGKFPGQNEAAHRDRGVVGPDSFEAVKDRIEDLGREAERLIKAGAAKTQDQSDSAADLADRLRKLETLSDSLRKKEKEPHDEAGRAVQKKWAPLITMAENCKARLKAVVVTPFLVAANASLAAAQVEAVRTGKPIEEVLPLRATAGGVTASRVTGLREVKSADITDYPKALAYFANNEKVRDLIQQLANAAVKQGTTPDGCEIHVEEKAA